MFMRSASLLALTSALIPALASTLMAAEPTTTEVTPQTLTLRQVVELSAATRSVDIAQMDAAIARAALGEQRMDLLPRIDATAGISRQRDYPYVSNFRSSANNNVNAQIRVGQALLDFAAWHNNKAAKRQLAASEAVATLAIEQAVLAGALGYIDAISAKSLISVRQEDLRLAQDLLTQAQAQVDAGTSEQISATRAASQVETARSALITAEGLWRRAVITLTQTLDLPPGSALDCTETLDEHVVSMIADANPESAETFALEHRTELRVSAETLAALQEQQAAAQGARLPRIDAFAEGGYGGLAVDEMDPGWRVGVALIIPIMDGSPYRHEQAKIQVAQQRLRQLQVTDKIRTEVRQALNTIATAQARLDSDRARRDLADAELEQAKARFDAGVAGNLEVIDAQRGHTTAQIAMLTAVDGLIQARVRLIAAMGSITALN